MPEQYPAQQPGRPTGLEHHQQLLTRLPCTPQTRQLPPHSWLQPGPWDQRWSLTPAKAQS